MIDKEECLTLAYMKHRFGGEKEIKPFLRSLLLNIAKPAAESIFRERER
jgi:hypothetical protein